MGDAECANPKPQTKKKEKIQVEKIIQGREGEAESKLAGSLHNCTGRQGERAFFWCTWRIFRAFLVYLAHFLGLFWVSRAFFLIRALTLCFGCYFFERGLEFVVGRAFLFE